MTLEKINSGNLQIQDIMLENKKPQERVFNPTSEVFENELSDIFDGLKPMRREHDYVFFTLLSSMGVMFPQQARSFVNKELLSNGMNEIDSLVNEIRTYDTGGPTVLLANVKSVIPQLEIPSRFTFQRLGRYPEIFSEKTQWRIALRRLFPEINNDDLGLERIDPKSIKNNLPNVGLFNNLMEIANLKILFGLTKSQINLNEEDYIHVKNIFTKAQKGFYDNPRSKSVRTHLYINAMYLTYILNAERATIQNGQIIVNYKDEIFSTDDRVLPERRKF